MTRPTTPTTEATALRNALDMANRRLAEAASPSALDDVRTALHVYCQPTEKCELRTGYEDAVIRALQAASPSALDVLDRLKERALAFWSDESIKNNYAFHPNVFWSWLDEQRVRLAIEAEAASPSTPNEAAALRIEYETGRRHGWEEGHRAASPSALTAREAAEYGDLLWDEAEATSPPACPRCGKTPDPITGECPGSTPHAAPPPALDVRAIIEHVIQQFHDGDQWRDGGNHPNSSIHKCGPCSRILDDELARLTAEQEERPGFSHDALTLDRIPVRAASPAALDVTRAIEEISGELSHYDLSDDPGYIKVPTERVRAILRARLTEQEA